MKKNNFMKAMAIMMMLVMLTGMVPGISFLSTHAYAAKDSAQELTVFVEPGETVGSTKATVADAVYGNFVVNITDTAIATLNMGESLSISGANLIEDYPPGADITAGVEVGKYLQVYDVDMENKVAAFYQKQLENADIKQVGISALDIDTTYNGAPVMFSTTSNPEETILINYNFENNVLDSSGNKNDGIIEGNVSYVPGYSGKAISSDGNGYIKLPQNLILNNTSFTISMQFKTTSSGGLFGYQNAGVGTGEGVCTQYVPVLSVRQDGKLYAEMWIGSEMTVVSPTTVNDGNWHRVVMTSGANSIRVYLDGVDIGGAYGVPQHLSMSISQIGTNAAWGRVSQPPAFTWNHFRGSIDNFTFYSTAQTASEIAKDTQTITFGPLENKFTNSTPFELTATASSGLPVSYTSSNTSVATISGSTVTIVGTGTTEISAYQEGNESYSAAPKVVQALTVLESTYTIGAIEDYTMSNLEQGYESNTQETKTITITRTGTCDLQNLAVSISGGENSDFIVTQPTITELNEGTDSTTFTLKAKDGLSVGTHTETVTILADNMPDVTFTITQVVLANSTISLTTATFDKNINAQEDVTTTMTLNGNTLSSIKNGQNTLIEDVDYTVSGNQVILKKEYLAQQSTGGIVLTFNFSSGDPQTLTITVNDSTPAAPPILTGVVGDTMTFAGMEWIILSTNPHKLILKDLVKEGGSYKQIQFDNGGRKYFENSTIDNYLSTTFLNSLGGYADYIQITNWNVGDWNNESGMQVSRKVGLLTMRQFANYEHNNSPYLHTVAPLPAGENWWLGDYHPTDNAVSYVLQSGNGKGYGNAAFPTDNLGIRPVIVLKPQNSTINPTTAGFDKNINAQEDIITTMILNGNTLSSIKNGQNTLIEDVDHTVSGNQVILKKEYLAQQSTGEIVLTFNFSSGDPQTLTITVNDSTQAEGEIDYEIINGDQAGKFIVKQGFAEVGRYNSFTEAIDASTSVGDDGVLTIRFGTDEKNPLIIHGESDTTKNRLKAGIYTGYVEISEEGATGFAHGLYIPPNINVVFKDLTVKHKVTTERGTGQYDLFKVIDLNSGTLTIDENSLIEDSAIYSTGIYVANRGSLTVKNGTIKSTGQNSYAIRGVANVKGWVGTIIIEDGNIISAGQDGEAIAAEAANITINGGNIQADNPAGASNYGIHLIEGAAGNTGLKINGGTISSNGSAGAAIYLEGSAFDDDNTNSNVVEITGGTIKSANENTLLIKKYTQSGFNAWPDAFFDVYGLKIYGDDDAYLRIAGVIDEADNNMRALTNINKNKVTVTANNFSVDKSFMGWTSDEARNTLISTTNGVTIDELSANGNKSVYLKTEEPDTTPPALIAGAVNRSSDAEATLKFTSNEVGQYYYAVVDKDAVEPTIDTSVLGTALTINETTITLADLTAGAKDIYIVVKDEAENLSDTLVIEIPAFTENTGDAQVEIIRQPINQKVYEGATATFEVRTDGAENIQYQWQNKTGEDWIDIANATNRILTLTKVRQSDNGGQYRVLITVQKTTVESEPATLTVLENLYTVSRPTLFIDNQIISADEEARQITLNAIGSKLYLNGAETNQKGTYSYQIIENDGAIASIDGNTLTLNPAVAGTYNIGVRIIAALNTGDKTYSASTLHRFTVTKQVISRPDWVLTPPTLIIANQTLGYDETSKKITLNATADIIGQNQMQTVQYTYEIIRGKNIATINADQLILNPPAAGEYTVIVKTTATAGTRTTTAETSLTVTKEQRPLIQLPEWTIDNLTFNGGTITIEAGEQSAEYNLTASATTSGSNAEDISYTYEIINDTANSDIENNKLTVKRIGTVKIRAIALSGAATATKEAVFTVRNIGIEQMENKIDALPDANANKEIILANEKNIEEANEDFNDLQDIEKDQVEHSKRKKLDMLVNRLGKIQAILDAERTQTSVAAWGLSTALDARQDLNAGRDVTLKLIVEDENQSSSAETPIDKELIENLVEQGTGGRVYNISLLKIVEQGVGQEVESEVIRETQAPVFVTLALPVNYQNMKSYTIIYVHTNANGEKEIERIPAEYNSTNQTITFPISRFSTFAITFEETKETDDNSSDDDKGSSGRDSSDSSTSKPVVTEQAGIVINGEIERAGMETRTEKNGRISLEVVVNRDTIERKIEEVLKAKEQIDSRNIAELMITDRDAHRVGVVLAGDVVKKLATNDFFLAIDRGDLQYYIPAKDINILAVAERLGVNSTRLHEIIVEVEMSKVAEEKALQLNGAIRKEIPGGELLVTPIDFSITAKKIISDGTTVNIPINKYVEKLIEVPVGTNRREITTGIAFNSDGTYSHVPTEIITKDDKYYAKINSLTNGRYSVIYNPTTVETVNNHWVKDTVNDMASRLVLTEIEGFQPDQAVTRAEYATYIIRALGLYSEDYEPTKKFADVYATDKNIKGITIATKWGIVRGYLDNTFKPDNKITREEAMAMYDRVMDITELTPEAQNRLEKYLDKQDVSEWAVPSVEKVLNARVFDGRTENTLVPKGIFTHAESLAAIRNLLVKSGLINK